MKDVTINQDVAKKVGIERSLILGYIKTNADSEGWTEITINDVATDNVLSLISQRGFYHYICKMVDSGLIIREYGCKTKPSRFKLTQMGEALFN